MKDVMQEDQKGCKKNNVRADEEQITATRTKQHKDEEEDTGIRPKKIEDKKADTSSQECDGRSERLQKERHT